MPADTAQHWCIVGGGMMGLTLAHRLAKHDQRVTVLEAGSEIGGLASVWTLEDPDYGELTWDRHYHVTLLSDLRLRALLAELGLEDKFHWVETKTGFFTDGELYSMSNTLEFLRFPPLSLWEKFRLGLTIFRASKIRDGLPLERVLVADWLRKWSGNSTFRKIWLPLLKAKLGPTYQQVSAAFIWATIARMYRARHSGLKKEMFGYVSGGYARILARFAERLQAAGVTLRTGCPVERVTSRDEGGVTVRLRSGESEVYDQVILTTPSTIVDRVCPELADDERKRHQQIQYLGILCASVVLTRPLSPFYVTNITDSWVPFTAVIEMTSLVDPQELAGRHLVYLPRYAAADDPAWQWSDDELREKFLGALQHMHPSLLPEEIVAFRVSRVKQVMALPTLDYSANLPPVETSQKNVYAINSAQITEGTLNVNEVIEVAERAFEQTILPQLMNPKAVSAASNSTEQHGQDPCELIARS